MLYFNIAIFPDQENKLTNFKFLSKSDKKTQAFDYADNTYYFDITADKTYFKFLFMKFYLYYYHLHDSVPLSYSNQFSSSSYNFDSKKMQLFFYNNSLKQLSTFRTGFKLDPKMIFIAVIVIIGLVVYFLTQGA